MKIVLALLMLFPDRLGFATEFATLALGLANRAYIMEGGQIQYSGMARELRENPAMLQSAYLLRTRNGAGTPQPLTGPQLHPR